jgi:hypothetical protein
VKGFSLSAAAGAATTAPEAVGPPERFRDSFLDQSFHRRLGAQRSSEELRAQRFTPPPIGESNCPPDSMAPFAPRMALVLRFYSTNEEHDGFVARHRG